MFLERFINSKADKSNGYTEDDARELFEAIKTFGMKNESMDYRSEVDDSRHYYTQGWLYKRGDIVESLSNGMIGKVHRCGANHLIVVTEDGIMFKSFIHDVQAL